MTASADSTVLQPGTGPIPGRHHSVAPGVIGSALDER